MLSAVQGTALSHSDRAESSNFLSLEHAIMFNMYILDTTYCTCIFRLFAVRPIIFFIETNLKFLGSLAKLKKTGLSVFPDKKVPISLHSQ